MDGDEFVLPKSVLKYIKEKLHVVNDGNIYNLVALTEGKSGAEVYRAKIISSRNRMSGIYIIKLIDMSNRWFSRVNNEAEKCKELHIKATDFRDRLVDLVGDPIELDGYLILLYRQANDSVLNSDSLEKLNLTEKVQYLNLISRELLSKLNQDYQNGGNIDDFFKDILAYRIDEGGTFYKKIAQVVERPSASAVLIGEQLYPGPAYYMQNRAEWITTCKEFVLFKGNMHGDLHCQNIICVKNLTMPENLQYSIIDYDSYNANGYLLFDHAYLELYLYLNTITENDLNLWRDSIEPLLQCDLGQNVESLIGSAVNNFRNAICSGIEQWRQDSCPHMKDDIEIQFCLARIAAGINFFSKGGITDSRTLQKILLYLGVCFKVLFKKIGFVWNQEHISKLEMVYDKGEQTDSIWKYCAKYALSYASILITDDSYTQKDYQQLAALSQINWCLVIDIGNKSAPDDISTSLPAKIACHYHINVHDLGNNRNSECNRNCCEWVLCKKENDCTYGTLWVRHQKSIQKIWKSVLSANGLKPCLFIFDVKISKPFAKHFLSCLLQYIEQLRGSRFISFQDDLFDFDMCDTFSEYKCNSKSWKKASLIDLARAVENYFPIEEISSVNQVILPCLDSIPEQPLTEKELAYYKTSVELVYSGIENNGNNSDFGESFYRGNEIQWRDIATKCDLPLINGYDQKLHELKTRIVEGSPRTNRLKLVHGAGTGGTTLSKRILWDLKEVTPAMRLIHYTKETANILLEIYRKTGKVILLSIEMGSTVINQEELDALISAVNSENGKLWVLQIERSHNNGIDPITGETEQREAFIEIPDTLPNAIAQRFYNKFKLMTTESSRLRLLEKITQKSSTEWVGQRCPFFYGFYTFEKEYNLDNIQRTISKCNKVIKDILSDLALITIYSQNICIPFFEVAKRILDCSEDISPQLLYEALDTSVSKIIVQRENGWRICHIIIAKKILQEIYGVERFEDSVYFAAKLLIEQFYNNYGETDERVDDILRELFIDRAVVDSERMKFSHLIEDIPEFTRKEEIFQILIDYYPDNPHYYNHLARLLVSKEVADYGRAVSLLYDAISCSPEGNNSIHYITLGCVYSKKVFSRLAEIRRNTKQGRFAMTIAEVVADVRSNYDAAEDAFITAKQEGKKKDSYTYVPYINLECGLIEKLAGCDKDERSMRQLLKTDESFKACYLEHYGKAVELFAEMQMYRDEIGEEFFRHAQGKLDSISAYDETIEKQLDFWLQQEGRSAQFARRSYSTALFARHSYSWKDMSQKSLELIEKAMYSNLTQRLSGDLSTDVDFWFESYRRLKDFLPERAIDIINDYKAEGYDKEFLLFYLQFLRLEKGFSKVSDVMKHSMACKDLTPSGINTIKPHAAYALNTHGCPIVPIDCVQRGRYGELTNLKEFHGTITDICGSTSAIIRIDGLNLEAVFVPSIKAEDGQKREFTSKNLQSRVKFNLLFSYSGLRAWNVISM